jgi:hypothetical protein
MTISLYPHVTFVILLKPERMSEDECNDKGQLEDSEGDAEFASSSKGKGKRKVNVRSGAAKKRKRVASQALAPEASASPSPVRSIAEEQPNGNFICRDCGRTWTKQAAVSTSSTAVQQHVNGKSHQDALKRKDRKPTSQLVLSSFFPSKDDGGDNDGDGDGDGSRQVGEEDEEDNNDNYDDHGGEEDEEDDNYDGHGGEGEDEEDDDDDNFNDDHGGDDDDHHGGSGIDGTGAAAGPSSDDVAFTDAGAGDDICSHTCQGYVPVLKDSSGNILSLAHVYPFHRHATSDVGIGDWTVTSDGVLYSNACEGLLQSSMASCSECEALRFKTKLQQVLEMACKDYSGDVVYTNNRYLNHRQLVQKTEANRAITNTLRLSNLNAQKLALRAARKIKIWKKIHMLLASEDVPAVR